MRVLAVALVIFLAGCSTPPSPQDEPSQPTAAGWMGLPAPHADPLAPGPLAVTTTDYSFSPVTVGGPDGKHDGYEYDSEVRGTLTMPDGPGPFPLAVFLHGQHQTGTDADPYRNDRGYVYLMEHLASHGIAVASALAHEINNANGSPDTGMWARGELVLATVDAFAASNHSARLDLTRIGLMGHSRGGEGVVTAAEVNAGRAVPLNLSAIIALAPTDFAYRSVPGIPFLTLAPYCDGDVYNLHGLRQFDQSRYVDDDAVKVQLLVMGANHNNYNTMWGTGVGSVPLAADGAGDDAGFGRHQNTHCDLPREQGGGRLTVEDTYAEATLHLGGFLRWTLLGEAALAPYFLGANQPAAACPGQVACPGAVHVSAMMPGRRDLFHVETSGLEPGEGVTATVLGEAATCQMTTCAENVYSSAWMADLTLLPANAPTGGSGIALRFDEPADLRDTPMLNVRVGVTTDRSLNAFGPPTMTITFADATGEISVAIDDPALFLPPGLVADPGVGAIGFAYVGGAKVSANAVTVAIPAGIDAGNVTAITVSFKGAGPGQPLPDRVLVADAWFNRDTAATTAPKIA